MVSGLPPSRGGSLGHILLSCPSARSASAQRCSWHRRSWPVSRSGTPGWRPVPDPAGRTAVVALTTMAFLVVLQMALAWLVYTRIAEREALALRADRARDEAMQRSEQQRRRLVDQVEQVIFQVDDAGALDVPQSSLAGPDRIRRVHDTLGQPFEACVHPEDRAAAKQLCGDLLARADRRGASGTTVPDQRGCDLLDGGRRQAAWSGQALSVWPARSPTSRPVGMRSRNSRGRASPPSGPARPRASSSGR